MTNGNLREPLRDIRDEVLMVRYASGDANAFQELFRRYEPRAYAFFVRRTGAVERAQDLYQELFLRIHRARGRYDPSLPFTPWFFQIASHLLVDDYRRAFRSHEVPLDDRDPWSAPRSAEEEASDREQVVRHLDQLSSEERYVLISTKVEGVGYKELADRLGKSVDAVKQMASRATRRLRASEASEGALPLSSS